MPISVIPTTAHPICILPAATTLAIRALAVVIGILGAAATGVGIGVLTFDAVHAVSQSAISQTMPTVGALR